VKFHPTRTLRFIFTAFLVGLFFSIGTQYFPWVLAFFVFSIVALKTHLNIFWFISFLFLGWGYGNYHNLQLEKIDILTHFYGEEVQIRGDIVTSVAYKKGYSQTHFAAKYLYKNDIWSPVKGKILLKLPLGTELLYGNHLEVKGKLSPVQNWSKEFNYKDYLAKQGIHSILTLPEVHTLPSQNLFFKGLTQAQKTRNFFAENIKSKLPSPHFDIANGVLLGVQQKLPKKTEEDFKNSGLLHILVVSGANVALILVLLNLLMKPLGPGTTLMTVSAGLFFFLGVVGPDPPVMRAVLFGILTSISFFVGRFIDVRNLLLFATFLIALFAPQVVRYDIGFYLTFSATIGIILGMPVWWKISGIIPWKNFRILLGVSFCAQIFVFPTLVVIFGEFPVSGIIANLIVEPFMPIIMGLSAALGALGSVPIVSYILGFLDYGFIQIVIWISQFFGQFGTFEISNIYGYLGYLTLASFIAWAFFSDGYDKMLEKFDKETR